MIPRIYSLKKDKSNPIYEAAEWLPLVRTDNEWREHIGILGGAGNVLFLDLDNGYKALFCENYFKLYTYYLCTLLYACDNSIKIFKFFKSIH